MRRLLHLLGAALFCQVGLFLLLLVFVAPTRGEEVPSKLVIGYQSIPNEEIVAKDLGWHEKALGIPVEWIEFDSGMHVNKAISAGTIDIGLMGSSPCAAGICRGVPLEVVWIYDLIGDNEALVVRKNSGIETVAQLKGKKVAAPFGSTTHYHLMVALMLNNVDADDVDIISLEPRQILDAWNRGEIDAAYVWMPTLSKMVEAGGEVILTSRQLVEKGFPTGDLCVVRKAFAEKYPHVVVTYLKTLDRAVRYCRDHPQESASSVARQFGISLQEAQLQMEGLILLTAQEQDGGKYFGGGHWNFGLYTVLKETADFLKEQGLVDELPPRVAFMQAVNAKFLVRALEE